MAWDSGSSIYQLNEFDKESELYSVYCLEWENQGGRKGCRTGTGDRRGKYHNDEHC